MSIAHPSSGEVDLVQLGPAFDHACAVAIPPHAEVELRGRLGPRTAADVRIVPGRFDDYAGPAPRLTMLRAFLYPDCSCEDFEHRPRGLGVPVEGRGVPLLMGKIAGGSSLGVVVRNNTCEEVEASVSVAFLALDAGRP
jgi:hypothetical protein